MDIPGMVRPALTELPQIQDRMTFLYLERCQLSRDDSAISVRDEKGVAHIPAAAISVLLLGPGTSVTHRAMELIGDMGVTVIWVGENGVRYYAGGRPLTHHAQMLQKQAQLVSNTRSHIQVARRMYQMRFPDENVAHLTMQQLRGREGSRVRQAYRQASKQWNISWNGRKYRPGEIENSDPVNQALTAGNTCLYGLAHAVIFAMGCSPGLGFVHVGHENSFVYDIADLYKVEIIVPLAFELASMDLEDIVGEMRRRVRDRMVAAHILERMVCDIRTLLQPEKVSAEADEVLLWNGVEEAVASGKGYTEWED